MRESSQRQQKQVKVDKTPRCFTDVCSPLRQDYVFLKKIVSTKSNGGKIPLVLLFVHEKALQQFHIHNVELCVCQWGVWRFSWFSCLNRKDGRFVWFIIVTYIDTSKNTFCTNSFVVSFLFIRIISIHNPSKCICVCVYRQVLWRQNSWSFGIYW